MHDEIKINRPKQTTELAINNGAFAQVLPTVIRINPF